MNLANSLTCSRAVLAVLFTAFLFSPGPSGKILALFYFVLAALTDYWDGVVARRMKEESQFGKLMDPIADKLLTLSAFINFWILRLIPFWMVATVVVRDVVVTGARVIWKSQSDRQTVRSSGKQKTALQILYIIAVLLYLIARQRGPWKKTWDESVLQFIYLGMMVIVCVTVWSGVSVLSKNIFPRAGRKK